jgi:hypothetical protein
MHEDCSKSPLPPNFTIKERFIEEYHALQMAIE